MQSILWVLVSIIAYVAGLIIIMRVTPQLLSRSFDEGLFMGIAALDIIGAICAFGAVVVIYALFNGTLAIRILNFLLLAGILFVAARMSMSSFRPRVSSGTVQASRIIAGIYCLFVAAGAVFYMVELFMAR
jgi:hypothetical protein